MSAGFVKLPLSAYQFKPKNGRFPHEDIFSAFAYDTIILCRQCSNCRIVSEGYSFLLWGWYNHSVVNPKKRMREVTAAGFGPAISGL